MTDIGQIDATLKNRLGRSRRSIITSDEFNPSGVVLWLPPFIPRAPHGAIDV